MRFASQVRLERDGIVSRFQILDDLHEFTPSQQALYDKLESQLTELDNELQYALKYTA